MISVISYKKYNALLRLAFATLSDLKVFKLCGIYKLVGSFFNRHTVSPHYPCG